MKLDLCKMFDVKEGQHFWIKNGLNTNEYFISNEGLFKNGTDCNIQILTTNAKIYYTKPIQLTKNTKNFLKLINKDYKYICRDEDGGLCIFYSKPEKLKNEPYSYWYSGSSYYPINMDALDIDLSFIQWKDEEPYLISELIGDEN